MYVHLQVSFPRGFVSYWTFGRILHRSKNSHRPLQSVVSCCQRPHYGDRQLVILHCRNFNQGDFPRSGFRCNLLRFNELQPLELLDTLSPFSFFSLFPPYTLFPKSERIPLHHVDKCITSAGGFQDRELATGVVWHAFTRHSRG